MYECPICLSANHSKRLHCSTCGTIPAMYSILRVPTRQIEEIDYTRFIPVVTAFGAVHSCRHHAARVNLRTVELDYYGEA